MSELRKNLVIGGVRYNLAVGQHGSGAPGEDTPGKVGITYLDTAADPPVLYVCTAAEKSGEQIKCQWQKVGGDDSGNDSSQNVNPISKTADMTQPVGVDADGRLWTAPTAGGGSADDGGDTGCNPGGTVDTSPVIAQYDVGYSATGIVNNSGKCVTIAYPFESNIDEIKVSAVYDATNDYLTTNNVVYKVAYYTPKIKFLESGADDSGNVNTRIAYLRDGAMTGHTPSNTSYANATVGSCGLARQNSECIYSDQIAFTLWTLDAEDSYAYWEDCTVLPKNVRAGDIIFAGKNTPYYGMANIDGTLPGGDDSGVTNATEDQSVMMLSFDRVYVDSGVYTEDLPPKWDGMFSIHRGMSTAPDNTLQAIWEAKKHGYNCCELDVRYTSDNQVVLCHNTTVTGTVDGVEVTYTVAETDLATLKTVCVGNTKFPNAVVCSLEDAMRLCRRIGMRPEIDYKVSNDQIYKDCVALSKKYGLQDDTLHCCYGINYAVIVKTAYEKANLRVDGSLLDTDSTLDEYLTKPGNIYAFYAATACGKTAGSNVGANVTNETRISTHKEKGYKMYVWNVTPYLLPDVMQWEPDILQPQSSKDGNDWYTLIRELTSFDGLVW